MKPGGVDTWQGFVAALGKGGELSPWSTLPAAEPHSQEEQGAPSAPGVLSAQCAAGMADPSSQAAQPARQGGQMARAGAARLQQARGPQRGKRQVRPAGPTVRASFVAALYACPPLLGEHNVWLCEPAGSVLAIRSHSRQRSPGPASAASAVHLLMASPLPHSPPPLADALLQRDALRPLSLVVEDLGNLAIALCAHGEHMDAAWRALAAQCDPRVAEGDGLAQGGLIRLSVAGWVSGVRSMLCCLAPPHGRLLLAHQLACQACLPTPDLTAQCCWWCSVPCCRTRRAASGPCPPRPRHCSGCRKGI